MVLIAWSSIIVTITNEFWHLDVDDDEDVIKIKRYVTVQVR